uniref:Uncharacterized protein n=1 Tax=Aegilops tauschii subsp. strangulata TaxID=200361 RepID=A0A453RF75_AEGTS
MYMQVQRVWNRWRTTAKSLKPKFNLFVKQVSASIGMAEPHIDIKSSIAFTVFLKAFGGLLFIIISSFGAFILVCTLLLHALYQELFHVKGVSRCILLWLPLNVDLQHHVFLN